MRDRSTGETRTRVSGPAGGSFLFGLLFALAPGARGAEKLTLDSALEAIARNVALVLKEEQNAREIVVNPITDKTELTHTAGTGITEALIEKLRAHGLEPALKAPFIFDGKYSLGEQTVDGVRKGTAIGSLAFTITRRNGQPLINSETDIPLAERPRVTDPRDLATMGGLTVALPPAAPAEENDKTVLEGIDNKPGLFAIEGTKIRPKGAPYAIEMLVAPAIGGPPSRPGDFHPQAVEVRQGMPFLKVQPGEAVAVRIINDAGHDVAAAVTVDGLNVDVRLPATAEQRQGREETGQARHRQEPHRGRRIRLVPQRPQVERASIVKDLCPRDHPKASQR